MIANQYELIREKFRLKYNGQSLSQIVHQYSSQGLTPAQILQLIQDTRAQRRLTESQQLPLAQDQQTLGSKLVGPQGDLPTANQQSLTKSQKKRKRKKLQEQMKKQEQKPQGSQGTTADHDGQGCQEEREAKEGQDHKIELIQCESVAQEKEATDDA